MAMIVSFNVIERFLWKFLPAACLVERPSRHFWYDRTPHLNQDGLSCRKNARRPEENLQNIPPEQFGRDWMLCHKNRNNLHNLCVFMLIGHGRKILFKTPRVGAWEAEMTSMKCSFHGEPKDLGSQDFRTSEGF